MRREIHTTPYSESAERGVLGSILIDCDRALRVCSEHGITKDIFYMASSGALYSQIISMKKDGSVIDLITVGERLKSDESIGMNIYEYIEGLVDDTPTAAHIEYYIEILKRLKHKRDIRDAISKAEDGLYDGDSDPEQIISSLTTSLVSIKTQEETGTTTDDIIASYNDARNGHSRCIPTPFDGLTMKTGGPMRGMETILTGRSKSGKSMFKSFWHRYLGEHNIPFLDCPWEDSTVVAKSRCASIGRYNAGMMIRGGQYVFDGTRWRWERTTDEQIARAQKQMDILDSCPMYWDDTRVIPDTLKSRLARYVDEFGIHGAFLDGAKDIRRPPGKYGDTGFDEEISAAIVDAAHELNLAIISIHHLTKLQAEELITSTHIRGSGNIVSDSRMVYALQGDKTGASLNSYMNGRPLDFNVEGYCTTRVLECIDNNHGDLGKVWMDTDLGLCAFDALK